MYSMYVESEMLICIIYTFCYKFTINITIQFYKYWYVLIDKSS